MKSFAISSFGTLASVFLVILVNMANPSNYGGSVQAAVLSRDGILPPVNVPLDLLPKYFKLMDKCNAGGPNTIIAVLYEGGVEITYDSGECAARKLKDGSPFQLSVFCKTALCNYYPNDDCTGGKVLPVPDPFPAGLPFPNPADLIWKTLGGAIKCQAL